MQSNQSKYRVIPYFRKPDGSWSIPEVDMVLLYRQLEAEGLNNKMFPFGGINNEIDFIIWFRNHENSMQVVSDDEGPLMVFWINKKHKRSCYFHFSCLKRSWGTFTKELFFVAANYIFGLKYEGKRIFDVIIGQLDSRNRVAIRFLRSIGVTILGEIPHYFEDISTGEFLPATMAYLTHEEAEKWAI